MTVEETFEDPLYCPHGRVADGKLFITFVPIDDLTREQYLFELFRLYFMVNEYRGKKPIVMHEFMRGTYKSRTWVLEQIRKRLKPYWSGYELAALYGEVIE